MLLCVYAHAHAHAMPYQFQPITYCQLPDSCLSVPSHPKVYIGGAHYLIIIIKNNDDEDKI